MPRTAHTDRATACAHEHGGPECKRGVEYGPGVDSPRCGLEVSDNRDVGAIVLFFRTLDRWAREEDRLHPPAERPGLAVAGLMEPRVMIAGTRNGAQEGEVMQE